MTVLKVVKERPLLTSRDRQTLIRLALGASYDAWAREAGISLQTVKNQVHHLYDKIEIATGIRPTYANIVLFAIFGRFLTGDEVGYLLEDGDLHDWRIGED